MRALILGGFLFSLLFAAPGLTMFIPAALSQSLHTGKARPLTFLEPARGSTTELNLGSGKATLHHAEDFEVFVTGTDRNGKPWSVHPGDSSALGLQALTGDLDRDGQNDLVLISLTGANGNLPGQIVSIITFETDGKPLLFTTWTTGNFTPGKPSDLADLDGDGRYEFLMRELRDDGGRDKFDAYTVTTAYSPRKGCWTRLGRVGGRKFPIFRRYGTKTAFDYLPPNSPPRDGRVIPLADRSNLTPVATGQLFIEHDHLVFRRNPKNSPEEIREPALPGCYDANLVFVDDALPGRTIRCCSLKALIGEFRQKKGLNDRRSVLFGQCRPHEFSPNCIWLK